MLIMLCFQFQFCFQLFFHRGVGKRRYTNLILKFANGPNVDLPVSWLTLHV